jgi:hypothetical protein
MSICVAFESLSLLRRANGIPVGAGTLLRVACVRNGETQGSMFPAKKRRSPIIMTDPGEADRPGKGNSWTQKPLIIGVFPEIIK